MKDLEKVSLAQEQFEKEYTQGIEEEGFYLSTGIGRDKKSKELTLELRIMPKEGKIEELVQEAQERVDKILPEKYQGFPVHAVYMNVPKAL